MPAGGVRASETLHDFDKTRREQFEKTKPQCYGLADLLMRCFAKCVGLGDSHFQTIHAQRFPGDTLKFIKYPKLDTQPDCRIPRLSEHTDWGSLTFVFTQTGGLEVQSPTGDWTEVTILPNSVVVNIGDALSLWTKKKLKSTRRRISWDNLPGDKGGFSIAYFVNPNADAERFPQHQKAAEEEYPAISFRDNWRARWRLIYGYTAEDVNGVGLDKADARLLGIIKKLHVANGGGNIEEHELKIVST